MGNTPNIRFKGFDEDWEQRKLGELCAITTGKQDANAMVSNGRYDFYTSGIDVFKIDKAAFEGPAITIAGNGASVGYMHLADGKFNAYQRTYVLTRFLADRQFLNVAIGNELPKKIQEEVRGSGIPYIVLNMLTDLNIPITTRVEQDAIGKYFQSLDSLITLHQRKCQETERLKKYMLQKMFPQKGKKIPEIRFEGFDGDWEERRLGEMIKELKSGLSRQLSYDDIGLPVVRANNIDNGKLNMKEDVKYWYKKDPKGADTSNYLIHKDDILINFINSEAKMGTATIVESEPVRDTIYTTNILKMQMNEKICDSHFMLYETMTQKYINYIKIITKPAVNQASFTTVDYKNYKFRLPVIKEQRKIAKYFLNLNNLIIFHQNIVQNLMKLKSYMIQNMFPKKGGKKCQN